MARSQDSRDVRPYLREGLLLLGFALLVVAAVVTVVVPELSEEPEEPAKGADGGL